MKSNDKKTKYNVKKVLISIAKSELYVKITSKKEGVKYDKTDEC